MSMSDGDESGVVSSFFLGILRVLNPYDGVVREDGTVDGSTVFIRHMITGGTSASIAVTAMAPIERIKLILQVQGSVKHSPHSPSYRGLVDAMIRIPKEQGFSSFYRGNLVSIIRGFPYQALNFAFRDKFKSYFSKGYDSKSQILRKFGGNLLSGGLAGSTAIAIVYPLDLARTKMAMDFGPTKMTRETKGIRSVISQAYKKDGFKGIYRGFWFSIFGVFIYRSCYFGIFDTAKDVRFSSDEASHSLLFSFCAAELAATISGFISYPFDTIRRSLMMQAGQQEKFYTSSFECMRKIVENRGVAGLYHGAFVNVLRGTGGALMLVIYDELNYRVWKKNAIRPAPPAKKHKKHHKNIMPHPMPNLAPPPPLVSKKKKFKCEKVEKEPEVCSSREIKERVKIFCDF